MTPKKSEENKNNRIGFMDIPEMRYQNGYALFAFVSCMDIILTWVILYFQALLYYYRLRYVIVL